MQIKHTVLARIVVLYILFGAVIATGVVVSFNKAEFAEGFSVGQQMANSGSARQAGSRVVIPEMFFDQTVIASVFPVSATDTLGGNTISAQISKLNVIVRNDSADGNYITSLCLSLLSLALYAAIFVVIFLVLSSLLKSIRSGEGFSHRNIALTRLIAILLIIATLLTSLAQWLDGHLAAKYLAGTEYTINTAFSPDFGQLITAVLIFVMAEVFAIGANLSDEEKLTI